MQITRVVGVVAFAAVALLIAGSAHPFCIGDRTPSSPKAARAVALLLLIKTTHFDNERTTQVQLLLLLLLTPTLTQTLASHSWLPFACLAI